MRSSCLLLWRAPGPLAILFGVGSFEQEAFQTKLKSAQTRAEEGISKFLAVFQGLVPGRAIDWADGVGRFHLSVRATPAAPEHFASEVCGGGAESSTLASLGDDTCQQLIRLIEDAVRPQAARPAEL